MTLTRPQVRDLLEANDISPSKSLGQNFVVDPNTVRRIARLAGVGSGAQVLEIGAGLGSLTLALAETGARVTALETDRRLVPLLEDAVEACDRVEVVVGDAPAAAWSAVMPEGAWAVVANLPYNVATSIVLDLLESAPQAHSLLVMVQREVAERFAARPRTPAYGAVSVKIAYWATARIVAQVPASVFVPRPNVESAVVEIIRRPDRQPGTGDPQPMFDLVRTAFGQRRKMLRKSLNGVVAAEQFVAADIEPTDRPEELDVDAWRRLSTVVTEA